VLDQFGGVAGVGGGFVSAQVLVAGHIKPWKPSERLDPRNGLAACPSHDVAFDTGLLGSRDENGDPTMLGG
jgi:putative restriction endonuclease